MLCCAERWAVELTQPVLTTWVSGSLDLNPTFCMQGEYVATESALPWKGLTLVASYIL